MRNLLQVLFLVLCFLGCSSSGNSDTFIKDTTGRYLFNVNEVLEVYYKEQVLFVKWRGRKDIQPLKINDSSFYMKELNEKIIFITTPKTHIELDEKTEHKGVKYHFKKMDFGEKTPKEYFDVEDFENAKIGFMEIQKTDSLNPVIKQSVLSRVGFDYLNNKDFKKAIEILKINTLLYPTSSNTYDHLGDAYLKTKDTTNAIVNYTKALSINPENRGSLRMLNGISEK